MVLISEVKAAIFKAAETFKRMGAIVEEFDLGLVQYADSGILYHSIGRG